MASASEYAAKFLPSYEQVRKAVSVLLLSVLFATFFVVPLYTLSVPDSSRSYTILDDLSNIVGTQTTPPPFAALYYSFLGFATVGVIAQMAVAFDWSLPSFIKDALYANWAMFVAALIAAVAGDQVAIYVRRNTRPDQNLAASNDGLSYIALAIPAISLCIDAYGVALTQPK